MPRSQMIVRIPPELLEFAKLDAERCDRSLAKHVQWILEQRREQVREEISMREGWA